jgi:hypothetical protein
MEASRFSAGLITISNLVHPCNREHILVIIIKMTCSRRFNGARASLVSRLSLTSLQVFIASLEFNCLYARGTDGAGIN